ncbi:hypothetical protein IGI04_040100 [Brassica rapa subsp. trilocularis]|uniref:Ubiquitin-like protease family profile domain-containing protein n=1 Tax=Brassica rapa subsp. trilocularis TaxID=1813537 RepID=A0ABQ7KLW6_BRACM|nr:hypothetical protein IGI04_040100 [Brassica rapa subsp. trilocularis]
MIFKVGGVDDLYFSRLLNNLHGRRIFQSSTSYRTFNFTNRCFSPTAISKAIRRKPYRGRIPPLSSPIISLITTNLVSPSCGRVFSSEISFAKLRRRYVISHVLRRLAAEKTLNILVLILLFPSICRSVTAWGHIFSDHIFSDNIFSNYDFQEVRRLLRRLPGSEKTTWTTSRKSSTMSYSLDDLHVRHSRRLPGSRPSLKMDLPEFPPRMFTLGEEPDAIRSISYHSDDTKLFKALCDCLTADEYEDLKASKLGVFIKFKELDFGWTSRLFEHLTGLNCDYIKDLENPRCEVTTEMAAFWEKMRVDIDTGPSIEQITEAFYNCDEWSRDDRMRLGYLAIYAGYIERKKFSSATSASLARLVMDLEKFENYPWGRVAFKVLMDSLKAKDLTQTGYTVNGFIQVLQVWAYYALPELGANYGSPIPNRPSPLLLAYKGGKRQRKFFKAAINKQTIVKNFVQKAFDEMFPKWDGDVDDPAADNIIKVMFNDPGWEWTMECWPVTGTRKVVKMEVSPVKNEVSPVKSESVVKEESSRPRKKARKRSSVSAETPVEKSLKDISDAINLGFGTCLKELKLLADRMVAVEKKVGITNRGGSSDDRQLTTTSNPPKPVEEPGSESVNGAKARQKEAKEPSLTTEPSSSRELCLVSPADNLPSDDPSLLILDKQVSTASDLLVEEARRQTKKETALVNLRKKSVREWKLAPTQQTPFKGNSTAKQIIPNKQVGEGYDPFAPYDKMKSKELTAWVQKDPSHKLPLKKKPRRCPSRFYQVLRTPLEWLTDHQMDAFINLLRQRYQNHPEHFRSDRICFLDHVFSRQWRASYPDFKSDAPDANGLGRRLPGGAWNYHAGLIPSFCQSKKVWGVDVDDIYAPVNFKNQHWIAIWISIPKRHIVVWDSIVSHISPKELDEVMEPFVTMVPYLLVECALSDEQKVQYTLEPYTYARQTVGVPQCRAGDCGTFTLKYIECHALGIEFPTAFDKKHGKTIREKMALDIFRELPMCHEWENQDNGRLGDVNRSG